MRVVVVRHGMTAWNAERRFQGHTDVELSPVGLEQARSVGRRLRGDRFAACVASDLRRTCATAEAILAEMEAPPALRLDPELREMNFGAWEGLTFEEISRRWPDEAERFRRREPVAPPRGETWSAFETRVWGGFERHRAAAAGGDLLLVVHGGVIHALLGRVLRLGGGTVPLHVDPAAVTELECEGHALRVSILNDRRHLDGFV